MTEEVLIDLKLEQDEGSFRQLAQLKGALMANRQEQDLLKKAYKEGNVTQKEYASEVVRLEAVQKKLNNAYSTTQREVTGLQSPFEKLSESMKEHANQINIAGLSLSSFLNPVTATIGIMAALGKAYASTTVGAKDLEHAQTQLGFAFRYTLNSIAKGISGGGEGGEGVASKVGGFFVQLFGTLTNPVPGGAKQLKEIANEYASINELLAENHRAEIKARGDVANRKADIASFVTDFNEGQKSVEERLHASSEAIRLISENEDAQLKIKDEQIELLKTKLSFDKDDEAVQEELLNAETERGMIVKQSAKEREAIQRLESNLLETEKNKTAQMEKQEAMREKKKKDDAAAEKKRKDDKGLADEMKRLEDIQKLREENSNAAYAEWWAERVRIAQEASDEIDAKAQADFDKEKKRREDIFNLIADAGRNLGLLLTTGLKNVADVGTQILKGAAIIALRIAKEEVRNIILARALASWESLATFGLAGLAKYAIIYGLVEGAFAGIESTIAGFDEGGKIRPEMGTPIRRKNGDNRVITARVGEVILNEQQQAALGGDATFARLGVPGFGSKNLGQSEFAIGGRVPLPDDSVRMMVRAFNRLKVAVVIEDVETKMDRRAAVREKAEL